MDQVRAGYELVNHKMHDEEWDFVTVVDGSEGKGKSDLALLLGGYTEPGFDGTRVALELEDLLPLMHKAPRFSSVIFDEAIQGAYKRDAMTGENRAFNKAAMISRKRGLHLILCIPNFWDLDSYIRQRRAKVWFSVERRGLAVVHFPSRNRYRPEVFWRPTHNYAYPKVDAGLWAAYSIKKDEYMARHLAQAADPGKADRDSKALIKAEMAQLERDRVEEIKRLGLATISQIMSHYATHGEPIGHNRAASLRQRAWGSKKRSPLSPNNDPVSIHETREPRADPAGEAAP